MNTAQLIVRGDHASATLRIAVAAYLARFKGQSRVHTESDLRSFVEWCGRQGLDPLAAQRPHVELFMRWMQEIGRYKPSTVSRRLSVVAGFYRTCVIDGLLESTRLRNTYVAPESRPSPRRLASATSSSKPCSPRAGNPPTSTTSPW